MTKKKEHEEFEGFDNMYKLFKQAREHAHEVMKPILLKTTTNLGLSLAVTEVAYIWARVKLIAEASERPVDDMFKDLVNVETKSLMKNYDKEIKELLKKEN